MIGVVLSDTTNYGTENLELWREVLYVRYPPNKCRLWTWRQSGRLGLNISCYVDKGHSSCLLLFVPIQRLNVSSILAPFCWKLCIQAIWISMQIFGHDIVAFQLVRQKTHQLV